MNKMPKKPAKTRVETYTTNDISAFNVSETALINAMASVDYVDEQIDKTKKEFDKKIQNFKKEHKKDVAMLEYETARFCNSIRDELSTQIGKTKIKQMETENKISVLSKIVLGVLIIKFILELCLLAYIF